MHQTPREFGYRMPAEWEEHAATWIAWPHQRSDWPDKFAPIPWVYTEIVRHLHQSELVYILVNHARAEQHVRHLLRLAAIDEQRIHIFRMRTDRVWTRDYGPIFIKAADNRLGLTDWQFNAWAKYGNWQRDDAIPAQIGKVLNLPNWQPRCGTCRVVLEGGSIDVNGQGLLLTTEECLLSEVQQRNPSLTRADYEQLFTDYLGIREVLWLGCGLVGDDTHGHIDDLVRFVGPRTVVAVVENNPTDPNYRSLQENLERLRGLLTQDGQRLQVVPLPMPAPVVFDGQRLPASYANFYISNNRVLVPTFNDPVDRQALGILAELFRDRQVVGIHAVDLVLGLGTLHCLTQQQPIGIIPSRTTGNEKGGLGQH